MRLISMMRLSKFKVQDIALWKLILPIFLTQQQSTF